MSFQCISIKEAKSLIEKDDLILIDIRDYNSFSKGHIENAIHVENLNIDNSGIPANHPDIKKIFSRFNGTSYVPYDKAKN